MGRGIVTINTDAGFNHQLKIGSYAYWIKADGLFLRGSGLFKASVLNSTDAEKKAILNALHILESSGFKAEKIIINRDNINAYSKKNGCELQNMMYKIIRRIRKASIDRTHKNYQSANYAEFRHVKAHTTKQDARSYVNRWCDEQCKLQLREYKQKLIQNGSSISTKN